MPRSNISSVTVQHIWDDDSTIDYQVQESVPNINSDYGPFVSVEQGGDILILYPESWSEIRDQIECFMESFNGG